MGDTPASDLVTTQEIADLLGMSHRENVTKLWRRGTDGFPDPIIDRGRVRLWSKTAVLAWARATDRLPEG